MFDILRRSYSLLSQYSPGNYMFPPVRYFLELTYRCNLSCPFCFINKNRIKNEMTTQEWFNIIDQIPFYSFISLVAGEVTVREDFFEILEKCCKKTFSKVSLITNGVLLNADSIKKYIKNNMLLFSVSIDGYESNHDKIRNKPGLYKHIYENLMLMKELKIKEKKTKPLIDVKSVILEDNLDDLPKIYRAAGDLNAEFFSLSFKRNNYLRQNSELKKEFGEEFYKTQYPLNMYFDPEHFIEVYKELESISKTSDVKLRWAPKFNPTGDCETIIDFFSKGNTDINELYYPCNIPFSSIFITPEGDIYPCLSYKAGNVRGKNIQKILNEEKHKNFRKQLKQHKIFNACQLCCDAIPRR